MVVILFRYEWGIWHGGSYEGRYVLMAPPVPAALLMLSWNLVRRQCGDYEVGLQQWEPLRVALKRVGYFLERQKGESVCLSTC